MIVGEGPIMLNETGRLFLTTGLHRMISGSRLGLAHVGGCFFLEWDAGVVGALDKMNHFMQDPTTEFPWLQN